MISAFYVLLKQIYTLKSQRCCSSIYSLNIISFCISHFIFNTSRIDFVFNMKQWSKISFFPFCLILSFFFLPFLSRYPNLLIY